MVGFLLQTKRDYFTSSKRLRLEIGVVSRISTVDPSVAVLPLSCTKYFLVLRMNFLYFGCCTKRSTATVMVSVILCADTTLPRSTRPFETVGVFSVVVFVAIRLNNLSMRFLEPHPQLVHAY